MPALTTDGTVNTIKNGAVTKKGTMDGEECSVYASNYYYKTGSGLPWDPTTKYSWFKSFNRAHGKVANTSVLKLGYDANNVKLSTANTSGYLIFYNPVPLKVNSIDFHNPTSGEETYRSSIIKIYGANKDCYDGSTFDKSKFNELAERTNISTDHDIQYAINISSDKYLDYKVYGYYYYIIEGSPVNKTKNLLAFPEITLYGEEYSADGTGEPITPVRIISQEKYDEEINKYGFCGAFTINNVLLDDDENTNQETSIEVEELTLPKLNGVFLTRCKFT